VADRSLLSPERSLLDAERAPIESG
jgi:hypothetical protein